MTGPATRRAAQAAAGPAELLGQAYEAADLDDVTEHVLGILAGARRAGLDPRITAGLSSAAVGLGAPSLAITSAGRGRSARVGAHVDDAHFLEDLSDAADEITGQLEDVSSRAAQAAAARARARSDLRQAEQALAAAQAMKVTWPCGGCHTARAAAENQARAAMSDASGRVAAFDDILAVVKPAARRLTFAKARLAEVPEDLAETYEPLYDIVHRPGGRLPLDGRWITGQGQDEGDAATA